MSQNECGYGLFMLKRRKNLLASIFLESINLDNSEKTRPAKELPNTRATTSNK